MSHLAHNAAHSALVRPSMMIELKSANKHIFDAAVVIVSTCECVWGGRGCGWGLHAPAYPSATTMRPRVTCLLMNNCNTTLGRLPRRITLDNNDIRRTAQSGNFAKLFLKSLFSSCVLTWPVCVFSFIDQGSTILVVTLRCILQETIIAKYTCFRRFQPGT